MKRISTLIFAVVILGGCVKEGAFTAANEANDCDGKGKSEATINYGDSYLYVTADTHTKPRGEIIYKLKPGKKTSSGIDYKGLTITIKGKEPDDQWLNQVGKASDEKKVFVCVDPEQPYGIYAYKVMVEGGSELDPRVHVEK